jgi:hypothetical protein
MLGGGGFDTLICLGIRHGFLAKIQMVYSGYKPRSLTNKEPGYFHLCSKLFDIYRQAKYLYFYSSVFDKSTTWVFAFLLNEDIVKRNNKQPLEGCDDFWKFYNEYYLQLNTKLP